MDSNSDAIVNQRRHRLLSGLRILIAFLGGVVAVVVPALGFQQYWGYSFLYAVCLCLVAGSFVVSVSAMQRPHWYLGAGSGFLIAIIPTAALVWVHGFDGGAASAVAFIIYLGACGLVLGSFGGLIGTLVCWGLTKNHRVTQSGSLKPWHLGVAVFVLDLLATGIVWAVVR